MDWVGASVIAPRPDTPIEFEVVAEHGSRIGHFRDSTFYCIGEAAGYPRKLIRRWRYADENAARGNFACAIAG